MADVTTKEKAPEAPRGERVPPTVDARSLIANMSKADLAALMATAQARLQTTTSDTPKLSVTLDAVGPEKAEQVIEALAGALEAFAAKAPDPLAELRRVAPEVETAIVVNSNYRRKSHEHSVAVAKSYLEHAHGTETVGGPVKSRRR